MAEPDLNLEDEMPSTLKWPFVDPCSSPSRTEPITWSREGDDRSQLNIARDNHGWCRRSC